jgi:hypothetical protein
LQQHAHSPIVKENIQRIVLDGTRLAIVAFILAAAIATNVVINLKFGDLSDHFPFIGAAVWVAILLSAPLRKPDWALLPSSCRRHPGKRRWAWVSSLPFSTTFPSRRSR